MEVEMHNRLEKWQLMFFRKDGKDNFINTAWSFTEFWNDYAKKSLDIEGKCLFAGIVYDHEFFSDGALIVTSYIKHVERLRPNCDNFHTGVPMCIDTNSGHKYYFYADDFSDNMEAMLKDILCDAELNETPGHYVSRELYDLGFL